MVPRIQFLFELEKVREIQLEDRERARNLVSVNVLEAGSVCIVRLALYHMFHFFVFHCYYAVKVSSRPPIPWDLDFFSSGQGNQHVVVQFLAALFCWGM